MSEGKRSKFQGLFDAARARPETDAETPAPESQPAPQPEAAERDQPKAADRPRGKRSDPAYEQISAYVRKQTYRDVKIALLLHHGGQDVSDLVEDLLSAWLQEQNNHPT